MNRCVWLSVLMTLCYVNAVLAQEVEINTAGYVGSVMAADQLVKDHLKDKGANYYKLSAAWRASGDSVSLYERLFGRPQIEAGLIVADYSGSSFHFDNPLYPPLPYHSQMGQVYTAFAAFKRDLVRSGRFTVGYKLENGVGYCTKPYDIHGNAENILIGARLSFFVGLGAYASLRLSPEWSVGLDAGFRHYSNGRTAMPNKGANTLDVGLQAAYRLTPDTVIRPVYCHGVDRGFKKRWYADVNGTWSVQTQRTPYKFESDWEPDKRSCHYRLYSAYSLSAAMMRRYSRKYASGLGLDYMYVPYTDDILATETEYGLTQSETLSKSVWSLVAHHEVFYKQVSLHASVGYYLYRHNGETSKAEDTSYFETVGLRWYPHFAGNDVYMGYNIRAHQFKASCMQLAVGVRL